MRKLLLLIPVLFQKKAFWVVIASFLRALLNFVGVAAVMPILIMALNTHKLLSYPLVSRLFYGLHFTSIDAFITAICIAVIGIFLIKNILNILLIRFQNTYFLSLFHYFSNVMFVEYYHKGLSFLKQNNSVILAHQVNNVCHSFVFNVLSSIITIISEVILILMLWIAMLCYNPMISFMLLVVFLPIGVIYLRIVKNKLQENGKKENLIRRQQNRLLQETFKGYAEVEINDAFPSLLKRFNANLNSLKEFHFKNEHISTLPLLLVEMAVISGMIILILMNLHAEEKTFSVLFGVFAVAALRMLPAIRTLMNRWILIKYNQYSIEIVREGCIQTANLKTENLKNRLSFHKKIQVNNISYAFPDEVSTPILENLTFTIEKGECIGIRGASGMGKTTLFHLLMGFYFPQKGSVCIDDVPLTIDSLRSWQNMIAYVSQDVFMMDASFAQNIALTLDDEEIDRQKVGKVLEIVKLKSLVDRIPEGMDANVRESANRLSGGEKQRIGIARALYKEAEVLFFDEATSALDSQTEYEIQQAIGQLAAYNKELTILMIAHRESSLACCHRIIDIEKIQNIQ